MADEATNYLMPAEADDDLDVVLRGYDRRQVDTLLGQYEARLTHTEQLLDAAERQASELSTENAELTAALRTARDQLARDGAPSYVELGERIAQILRLAEEEAGALRAAATVDAERLREQAMEQVEREHAALVVDLQRQQHELNTSRAAAEQESHTLRQEGVAHAEWLVSQARDEADRLLADACREVAELARQREQVHGELTRLREILTTATDLRPKEVCEA